MLTSNRRYDIDWVRVIAIGLLLIYHTAIGFQSWGIMIGFIATDKPWPALWTPMLMLNVWRIPLLFFVSGMGVFFAIQSRTWKELILERAGRILIPFLFGMFVIVPLGVYLWQYYYNWDLSYSRNPGHLWFLGNIFAYVLILSPAFFFLKKNGNGKIAGAIKWLIGTPLGIVVVMAAFIAEAMLVDPRPFELYAMTWHGFFLGLIAFFFGFCFVLSGPPFWQMILKWRSFFIAAAVLLYAYRITQFQQFPPNYLLAIESNCWIIAVFAFAYRYLNHPSKALDYLSQAAYPVYILHMIFLYLGSLFIFPLDIPSPIQYPLLLVFTLIGCFVTYEYVVRRINLIRPLFGLRMRRPVGRPVVVTK